MTVKVEDIIARLDPELRREIGERAAELIADENTRRDLRRALRRAKVGMARELGIGWADISRLERQSDRLLSTLRDKLEAMGGTLSLTVSFPDRSPSNSATWPGMSPATDAARAAPTAARKKVPGARALKQRPPDPPDRKNCHARLRHRRPRITVCGPGRTRRAGRRHRACPASWRSDRGRRHDGGGNGSTQPGPARCPRRRSQPQP